MDKELTDEEYYAGKGCKCSAYSSDECGCGDIDWTDPDIYKLKIALHDAIDSPKGVVPKTAEPFYDQNYYDNLQSRRRELFKDLKYEGTTEDSMNIDFRDPTILKQVGEDMARLTDITENL